MARLAAIFIGMALLEPVLLIWHFVVPGEQEAHVSSPPQGGE
jgi:hypothetical protein